MASHSQSFTDRAYELFVGRLRRYGRLLDPKFRHHKCRYVAQCGGAALAMLVVLLILDHVKQTVLIASLGASAFIAFTMPHVNASNPRYLVGGYAVGTCVGCAWWLAASSIAFPIDGISGSVVFGAVAMGCAMFLMVITDTEHPPAAALALGYVLNEWDLLTVIVILTGIVAISMIKEVCKPTLMNLL